MNTFILIIALICLVVIAYNLKAISINLWNIRNTLCFILQELKKL